MRVKLEPRYSDYDSRGHVNNAVYLTYFEVARHRAWRVLTGLTADFPFIIAEAHVKYVSQAKFGDPLAIDIKTTEMRNKAWVWAYRIVDLRDERLVAEGSTVQVYYDYDLQQTMPIPDFIRPNLMRD
jgi:acyl-CoA thioester hydrolase